MRRTESDEEIENEAWGDMFGEPEDFYKPDPLPHEQIYVREATGEELKMRLVGNHPLWAHQLWNAGKLLASLYDSPDFSFDNKNVLELGAGAGLPSLIAAKRGAKKVVITDYPDKELIDNIQTNVELNCKKEEYENRVYSLGHLWGANVDDLLQVIKDSKTDIEQKFDIIILADLIFNHVAHAQLLTTCINCLAEDGVVWVSFSHHRPQWADKDLHFFELAQTDPYNFTVEHLFTKTMKPMYEHDYGPAEVRAAVHVKKLIKKK